MHDFDNNSCGGEMGRIVSKKSSFHCLVLLIAGLSVFITFGIVSAAMGPMIGGCPVFMGDNVWNNRIDSLPVDLNSSAYISSIGSGLSLHPDFGSGSWDGGPIGIPYTIVSGTQPKVGVAFGYAAESDPGPYPIPADALIEGGPLATGDRHVLVLDKDHCKLYETWSSWPQPDGSWNAGSGAIFDLMSNTLRPDTWTSADAAGLPILPGLVRYDEVASGEIHHAIRFTAGQVRQAYVWPARHYAGTVTDPNIPPMGQRFRLKAGVNISSFSADMQVILTAMKRYGIILADIGTSWYISGAPDPGWNNDQLVADFQKIHGYDFEAVDESSLMQAVNSGQVCGQHKARIGTAPYDSVGAAYTAAVPSGSPVRISLLGARLTESPDFNQGHDVILQGGYDCGFQTRLSYTVLGALTLTNGSTELDSIVIMSP